jgi:DNA-binding LytR/AlgR family response regulator
MNIKILVIEDDINHMIAMERFLDKLGYEDILTTDNSEEALRMITLEHPDLILADIDIKGKLNGIQIAQRIQNKNLPLIFVTSFDDNHIYEKAKETRPVAYLIKPFNELTLQSTIEFAITKMEHQRITTQNYKGWIEDILVKDSFFIKSKGQIQKIKISEILFIQADGNYCMIQTTQKKYATKTSLSKLLRKLERHNFLQIHRAYIIPLGYVDNIQLTEQVVAIQKYSLPLGKSYKDRLLEHLDLI